MKESYQPSKEEIGKAEEMMTPKQEEMTYDREDEIREKEIKEAQEKITELQEKSDADFAKAIRNVPEDKAGEALKDLSGLRSTENVFVEGLQNKAVRGIGRIQQMHEEKLIEFIEKYGLDEETHSLEAFKVILEKANLIKKLIL